MQRLGAIGHGTKLRPFAVQHLPERQTIGSRHRDFIAQLTRKTDPEHPCPEAAKGAFGPGHERQRLARQIHAADLFQQFPRLGANNGDLRKLFGQIGGINFPVPPFTLQPVFHPAMDPVSAA